jgi:hypothetical protein
LDAVVTDALAPFPPFAEILPLLAIWDAQM